MKYKWVANWHGQNIEGWTTAKDEKIAFKNAVSQISTIVQHSWYSVYLYINNGDKINIRGKL